MAQNVTVAGASYSDVPSVVLPKTGGGTASFTDVTDTTAAASDVASGKYFYTAAGVKTEGTATGGGGGGIVVTTTQDSHGGDIVEITAVDLSSDTVAANKMLSGTTAHNSSGTAITGSIATKTSSDLTASGATVTAPAGYYAAAATKSVSSGRADLPYSASINDASLTAGSTSLTFTGTVPITMDFSAGYISSDPSGSVIVSMTHSPVNVTPAHTYHPSTSDQTIVATTYATGAQTIKAVTLTNLTAANIKSGVTVKVGDSTDDDCVASVTGTYTGGGGMNKQIYYGPANVKNNGYTSSSATLTVATTGTYKVSWTAWRSSSQGTMGTNLYRNSTAGTNQQTFTGTYGQCITLTGQSYTAGDVLTIYATSGSTSRTIYIANFVIEQTA